MKSTDCEKPRSVEVRNTTELMSMQAISQALTDMEKIVVDLNTSIGCFSVVFDEKK